jgi:hypothetical protein
MGMDAGGRASGDSGSGYQHALSDQIASDRHPASMQAARSKGLCIRLSKLVPPVGA